jgi:hypothetical protein
MGKLIGVECVECRRKGHHCQAQIVVEDEPLCLRCADGEACCYVTGAGFRDGFNFAGADEDDPCQPILPAQPVYHRAHEMRFLPPNYTTTERDRFRCELRYASIAEVAKRHGMEPEMIAQFADPDENPQPKPLSKRAEKKLKAAINRPVRRVIDGEVVRMAPGAVMGPEFLKHKPQVITPLTVLTVRTTVAEHYAIDEERLSISHPGTEILRIRQLGMYLACELTEAGITEIGKVFGEMHWTTVRHAKQVVELRSKQDFTLKKNIAALKAKLGAGLQSKEQDFSTDLVRRVL